MMVKITNELMPTIIVIIVVVLLAALIVYNSNRNQREVIETVRQAIRKREENEAMIKSTLKEPEQWETANDLLKLSPPSPD